MHFYQKQPFFTRALRAALIRFELVAITMYWRKSATEFPVREKEGRVFNLKRGPGYHQKKAIGSVQCKRQQLKYFSAL